ncbi:hypothetical protein C7H19_16685 [Aphanothece hegewaldii CCALA 016]|uniref:Uncharacterized protein n=1 Tax=Aphanothece hegewaldii CCALA 016 TaxID=2107694 RepID=A0A2T1LUW0_9CHRO|nr:hypothetical protein [Aphanothece hegewaldii]PSF35416.1 hypothetical protein C7H19_16685 [Aphanothece hegewaldii CCALA 016]
MEPTLEQYQQLYISCSTITRQLKWHIRWVEQVPGGEIVLIAQPPNANPNERRRIIVTIQVNGRVSYGGTGL